MVVLLIVMDIDGSKSLRAANNVRCFTGKCTQLFESELPNSTVTGMTYLPLLNVISTA